MEKGSKYIRKSRIDNWAIASGFTGIGIIGLFLYLSLIGAIEITGYNYTEHCAGSRTEPCFLYINFTANNNVYIQAHQDWLKTDGELKELIIQRSWGKSWRTIYLNQTWNKRVKYAIKFKEGQDYQIRFIAYKNHPKDIINWDFNPQGTWKGGLAELKCDKQNVTIRNGTECVNGTEYIDELNTTVDVVNCTWKLETVEQCIANTGRIEYADKKIDYEEDNIGCTAYNDSIICDDGSGGDGNGDGVCSAGETCYTFELDTGIDLVDITDGSKNVTKTKKPKPKVKDK